MQAVLPNEVYISSWIVIAGDGNVLEAEGITHVISVMKELDESKRLEKFKRMIIDVNDSPGEIHFIDSFEPAIQWIDDALGEGGKVLVHWCLLFLPLLTAVWPAGREARPLSPRT